MNPICYRLWTPDMTLNEADLVRLYKEANWYSPAWHDTAWVNDIPRASFAFVCAFENDRLIGMARALSDGVSDAYIQDVTVLKAYRKRGIGAELIRVLIAALQEAGIDWIGLIGEPGTEPFYRALGFSPLPNALPMKFSGGAR